MIKNRFLADNRGFTYLLALTIIVVMGIMLGAVGQSWKTVMQREKEEELIFRGLQIQNAIIKWHKPKAGGHPATPLNDMKDLLYDPRSLTKVRYLRKLYDDPMTGKEWNLLRTTARGIVGIASSSEQEPMKVTGFPDDLKNMDNKKKYSEWQFGYSLESLQTGAQNIAGSQSDPNSRTTHYSGITASTGAIK